MKSLAQRIVELIDEHTDSLDIEETFIEAGASLAKAVEVIDARYAEHCFVQGVMDACDAIAEDMIHGPS